MAAKIILLLAMLLGASSLATIVIASPEEGDKDSYVVTGTLEELDLAKASGKIKTDLGQTVVFTLTSPDLFKGLSVGKRIAVRLNEKGQVIKVMEMTIPELPSIEK
jgi:hypothetical protein